jgi:hypothetical protein
VRATSRAIGQGRSILTRAARPLRLTAGQLRAVRREATTLGVSVDTHSHRLYGMPARRLSREQASEVLRAIRTEAGLGGGK